MITLSSKLNKLQAEFDSLQAEHNKLTEANAALEKQLKDTPTSAVAVEQLTKDFEASKVSVTQLTEANTALSQEVDALKADKKNFEEMVAAKAVEIVSAQGVPPLSTKPSAQPSSSDLNAGDILAQYEALKTNAERAAFFAKNIDAMTSAIAAKKK